MCGRRAPRCLHPCRGDRERWGARAASGYVHFGAQPGEAGGAVGDNRAAEETKGRNIYSLLSALLLLAGISGNEPQFGPQPS